MEIVGVFGVLDEPVQCSVSMWLCRVGSTAHEGVSASGLWGLAASQCRTTQTQPVSALTLLAYIELWLRYIEIKLFGNNFQSRQPVMVFPTS